MEAIVDIHEVWNRRVSTNQLNKWLEEVTAAHPPARAIAATGNKKYLEQLDRILAPGGFWLIYGFIKTDETQTGTGLTEEDVHLISSRLALVSRRDGFDRRGPSAWFLFQK